MEATEKIRLLLQHWIDHNDSHAEEYRKWQTAAIDPGLAAAIAGAVEAMSGVNDRLRQALALAGGTANETANGTTTADCCCHGGHHHHHGHAHSHEHAHAHEHSHGHGHHHHHD